MKAMEWCVLVLASVIPMSAVNPLPSNAMPGMARPVREVTLSGSQDGVLAEIPVVEGQFVKAGDPVAILDQRLAQAAVAAAQAAADRQSLIDIATSEIDQARNSLKRFESVSESGAAAQTQIDEAKARLKKAEANLRSAHEERRMSELQLELEKTRLARHTMHAPFDAVVVRVLSEPGSTLGTGDPVVHLVALDALRLDLHLPLHLYGTLTPGMTYMLDADVPVARQLSGTLLTFDPIVDSASRTFRAVFEIPNPERALPAGFAVRPILHEGGLMPAQSEPTMRTANGATTPHNATAMNP